ncbi:hypothetical protein FBU30_002084 [Linnemannia zychae]|nr:hypothetical protein FBU30_002084 [Linnemannia zychae]
MVAFYSIKDFYDLDVSLKEEDYRRLGSILPYVESIHLTVSSLETVTIPLKETHPYLKKFSLVVPSLSYEFLQDILISFPNMKHLIVHAEPQVDLQPEDDRILCGYVDIDVENGSRLEITSGYEGDAEVADMIAVIPNLQYFNYFDMRDKCFVALAQHCPHLKDVNADWEAQVLIASNDYDDVPPPTINLLLTSCPELESINCPDHTIHIQHIMEGSHWVCKRLMFFRCQLVGIPQCEPWNEELYKSLEERLLEMSFEEISILSDNECKALNVLKQRKLCQEAMERQFQTLPQIKERYLFGDYMTHQLLPN